MLVGAVYDGGRLTDAVPRVVVAVHLALLVLFPLPLPALAAMTATSSIALRQLGWPQGWSPVSRPLGLYFLLAMLVPVLTLDVGAARHWVEAVLIVAALFAPSAVASAGDRLRICRFVVCMAGALAAYAVVEVVVGLPPIGGVPRRDDGSVLPMPNEIFLGTGLGRAEATLRHPLLLSFILLVAIGLALHPKIVPRFRWRLLVVLGLFGGILASGSRSAAAVAVLLVLFTFSPRPWVGLLTGASGLLALVLVGVAGGVLDSAVVRNFLSDPSLSHRLAGVDAAGHLMGTQSGWQTVIGNGYWQVPRLFDEGKLQSDGFHAVDNQFVYTFAELGIVGLLALAWVLWRALLRTDGLVLRAVAAGLAMFLSYDVLVTPSSLGVLVVLLGLTRGARLARDAGEASSTSESTSDGGG